MIYKQIFIIFSFLFFLQTSDNFLYWEDIAKEEQTFILQTQGIYSDIYKVYNGTFPIGDNDSTKILIDSLSHLPYDANTKALYFYVFNKICQTSDGALAELLPTACLNILLFNSEYVILYLQGNPQIQKRYAQILGPEFYFKDKGLSDFNYNYAVFKSIINNNIAKKQGLLETFSCLCCEIEVVMQNME